MPHPKDLEEPQERPPTPDERQESTQETREAMYRYLRADLLQLRNVLLENQVALPHRMMYHAERAVASLRAMCLVLEPWVPRSIRVDADQEELNLELLGAPGSALASTSESQ